MIKVGELIDYVTTTLPQLIASAESPRQAALYVQRHAVDNPRTHSECMGPSNAERRRLAGLWDSLGRAKSHCWWLKNQSYRDYLRVSDQRYRRE